MASTPAATRLASLPRSKQQMEGSSTSKPASFDITRMFAVPRSNASRRAPRRGKSCTMSVYVAVRIGNVCNWNSVTVRIRIGPVAQFPCFHPTTSFVCQFCPAAAKFTRPPAIGLRRGWRGGMRGTGRRKTMRLSFPGAPILWTVFLALLWLVLYGLEISRFFDEPTILLIVLVAVAGSAFCLAGASGSRLGRADKAKSRNRNA